MVGMKDIYLGNIATFTPTELLKKASRSTVCSLPPIRFLWWVVLVLQLIRYSLNNREKVSVQQSRISSRG